MLTYLQAGQDPEGVAFRTCSTSDRIDCENTIGHSVGGYSNNESASLHMTFAVLLLVVDCCAERGKVKDRRGDPKSFIQKSLVGRLLRVIGSWPRIVFVVSSIIYMVRLFWLLG